MPHIIGTLEEPRQNVRPANIRRTSSRFQAPIPWTRTVTELPTELLMQIFLHFVASHLHRFKPYSWIPGITHICRYWRTLALGMPALWNRIVVLRLECVLAMLQRSRPSLLSVQVGSFESNSYRKRIALGLLMEERRRIASVELRGPWDRHDELIRLSNVPTFQRLHILGYRYSWTDSVLSSSLRHLSIQGFSDLACVPSTIHEMLDALDRMSLLESLTIKDSIPFASSGTTLSAGRISILPNLRSLSLSESARTVALLLGCISFPASTTVMVECLSAKKEGELALIAGAITSRMSSLGMIGEATPLHSLSISRYGMRNSSVRIQGWTATEPIEGIHEGQTQTPPTLTLYVSSDEFTDKHLITLCRNLPVLDVQALSVSKWFGQELLEILQHVLRFPQVQFPNARIIFPQINELALDHIIFKDFEFDKENHFTPVGRYHPDYMDVDIMRTILYSRNKYGPRINNVIIRNCLGLNLETVANWVYLVGDISWDGLQKSQSSLEQMLGQRWVIWD